MILLILLVVIVSIYEIADMRRRKQKKEIVIYTAFAVITLALGYLYIINPYRRSLAGIILSILGYGF